MYLRRRRPHRLSWKRLPDHRARSRESPVRLASCHGLVALLRRCRQNQNLGVRIPGQLHGQTRITYRTILPSTFNSAAATDQPPTKQLVVVTMYHSSILPGIRSCRRVINQEKPFIRRAERMNSRRSYGTAIRRPPCTLNHRHSHQPYRGTKQVPSSECLGEGKYIRATKTGRFWVFMSRCWWVLGFKMKGFLRLDFIHLSLCIRSRFIHTCLVLYSYI
jgi:hypothetical protein